MTAKQKAENLIKKYEATSEKCHCLEYMCICFRMGSYKAAECAIIAVNEILSLEDYRFSSEGKIKYWDNVKKELNKMAI